MGMRLAKPTQTEADQKDIEVGGCAARLVVAKS